MVGLSRDSPFALLGDPEYAALSLIRFSTGMSFATIIIALALYADLFQASGIVAGLFGTVYAVTRLFLVLPVGRYADTGNAKRFMLGGMGLHIVVLIGFILIQSVEHVILLRLVQGMGSIVVYISGTAIVGSISPDGKRGLWIGMYQQVGSFSSLSGDLVGGALLFAFGFEVTYLALIAVSLVATTAALAFVRPRPIGGTGESRGGVRTLIRLLRRRAIIALCSFRFAFSFGKMAVVLFLPIYARTEFGMSALVIGGILAGGKLTKSIAQGYVGNVADRMGNEEKFIVVGIGGYALGTGMIPFAPAFTEMLPSLPITLFGWELVIGSAGIWLFLCYGILGLADSLRIPTSVSLFVAEGEHFDAVGSSLSLRSVSWQVGAIVGPLAVGGMLDFVSFFAAFWLAASFMIGAGIVFTALYQSEPAPDAMTAPGD